MYPLRLTYPLGIGVLTLLLLAGCTTATRPLVQPEQIWEVHSPDQRLQLQVRTTPQEGLEYRVLYGADPARQVLDWSPLGLTLRSYDPTYAQRPLRERVHHLHRGLQPTGDDQRPGEDRYTLKTGKRLHNHVRYRERSLYFQSADGTGLALDLRAYDEGVALRYRLPAISHEHYQILAEHTGFAVGKGATHWGAPYDYITLFHPSYETQYLEVPSGTQVPRDKGTGWAFPSLFHRDGLWWLLHETDLDPSYHGSRLHPDAPGGLYRVAPPLEGEALGYGSIIPSTPLPWASPWRMLAVGERLADIVESNLVYHLAAPSKVADESWIEPGLSSWSWWSDHGSSQNPAALKDFIDLAAEMGWPYSLVDANWNLIGPDIMPELVDYARQRNVGLLFWYNSGGRHNAISEQPRNRLDERLRRRTEFAMLQQLGVRGIKIDFFQSDKQDIIQHYIEIFEDAAEFQLMLVLHGSTIPRGWERTWPHVMTLEAVRGAEFYTFSPDDYGARAPRQNAILPFVRNVIGPMDYTPGIFAPTVSPRYTTNAHEAALLVVFESGIQHVAESAAVLRQLPESYRRFLAQVPAAWDETRLLAGYPGQFVVLARRSGQDWYLAGINGEAQARTLTLDVRAYGGRTGVLLEDVPGAEFSARPFSTATDTATLTLQPWGGFVLHLPPREPLTTP